MFFFFFSFLFFDYKEIALSYQRTGLLATYGTFAVEEWKKQFVKENLKQNDKK